MVDRPSATELSEELRMLVRSKPAGIETAIESVLEQRLAGLPIGDRLEAVETLAREFEPGVSGGDAALKLHSEEISRLVSLLLGRKASVTILSPAELSEKLAQSLNTVFDTLNQIVGVIQASLLGQKAEQETIRQIIGSQIGGDPGDNSLQNYLAQIKEAFLVGHKAFQISGKTVVSQLLKELDPDRIIASTEGRMKFGPFRKAEQFEVYRERYAILRRSFESGRLMEGFLKEFEKACQRLYKL
jgi:hypothetical protein